MRRFTRTLLLVAAACLVAAQAAEPATSTAGRGLLRGRALQSGDGDSPHVDSDRGQAAADKQSGDGDSAHYYAYHGQGNGRKEVVPAAADKQSGDGDSPHVDSDRGQSNGRKEVADKQSGDGDSAHYYAGGTIRGEANNGGRAL